MYCDKETMIEDEIEILELREEINYFLQRYEARAGQPAFRVPLSEIIKGMIAEEERLVKEYEANYGNKFPDKL